MAARAVLIVFAATSPARAAPSASTDLMAAGVSFERPVALLERHQPASTASAASDFSLP